MLLGNKMRSLRDEQGILQRQVAAYLEMDTPKFSKIERGDRRAKRSQVIQMATYFKVDEKEMLTLCAENGGYPPTQNGDIRSLFWLFSLMALQN